MIPSQYRYKILQLSIDNLFLKEYYGNYNKNIWLRYYDTQTGFNISYKIEKCISYPHITTNNKHNNIFAILLCRGFSPSRIKDILTSEYEKPIPHFDLYNFLRSAISHYNTYGIYQSQLDKLTVNSFEEYNDIPKVIPQQEIEKYNAMINTKRAKRNGNDRI